MAQKYRKETVERLCAEKAELLQRVAELKRELERVADIGRDNIAERDAEIAELKAANERLRSAGLALIKRLEALSGTVDEPKNIRPIDLLDEYSTLRRALIIYDREESEG